MRDPSTISQLVHQKLMGYSRFVVSERIFKPSDYLREARAQIEREGTKKDLIDFNLMIGPLVRQTH